MTADNPFSLPQGTVLSGDDFASAFAMPLRMMNREAIAKGFSVLQDGEELAQLVEGMVSAALDIVVSELRRRAMANALMLHESAPEKRTLQ